VLLRPHERVCVVGQLLHSHVGIPEFGLPADERRVDMNGCTATNRGKVFRVMTDDFKGVPAGASGLRLLIHRFPTRIRGRLGIFACFTLSHTPFPTLGRHKHHMTKDKVEWPTCCTLYMHHMWGLFGKEA
jgi:hypothetical protein